MSEKTDFGSKIALSQLIDGAARKTYYVLKLSEDHVSFERRRVLKKPIFHRSTFS